MPSGATVDYEVFDYKAEEKPLSLDQAIKRAHALRREDSAHLYRVRAINRECTRFTVKKVAPGEARAKLVARVATLLAKGWRRR